MSYKLNEYRSNHGLEEELKFRTHQAAVWDCVSPIMASLGERIKWGKQRAEDELRLINTEEKRVKGIHKYWSQLSMCSLMCLSGLVLLDHCSLSYIHMHFQLSHLNFKSQDFMCIREGHLKFNWNCKMSECQLLEG